MPCRWNVSAGFTAIVVLTLGGLSLITAGCTTRGLYQQGIVQLKQENYVEAVRILTAEVEQNPANWMASRDLGIALFKTGQNRQAVERLNQALASRDNDGAALFFLGATYEQLQDDEQALAAYRQYDAVGRFSPYRARMEDRAKQLVRERAQREMRDRIAREEELRYEPIPGNAIGVLPLAPQGLNEEHYPLAAAMAEWIMTDLAKIERLSVVERLRLNALLDEMNLAQSGLVDSAMALRTGRLISARRLVGGSLLQLSDDQLRVDLIVTETERGVTEASLDRSGPLQEFFRLEKEVVFSLLEELGIEPTALEREEIERIPTRNLSAMLAFGRGLIAERKGEVSEARSLYEEATDLDADFGLASDALDRLPTHAQDEFAPESDDTRGSENPIDDDLGDRLEETDNLTGGDTWPDDPSDVRPGVDVQPGIPDPPELPDPPEDLGDSNAPPHTR